MTAPLAVTDREAASMFRLKPAQFAELVKAGALPPPKRIGKYERWDVEDLKAILDGKLARPSAREFDL